MTRSGKLVVRYAPIPLENPVAESDFIFQTDGGQLKKLKQTLFRIINKYQDERYFKQVVIPNIIKLFQKKVQMYDLEFNQVSSDLSNTVNDIKQECAFYRIKIDEEFSCSKAAENNPSLDAQIKRKNRLEQLLTRIRVKQANCEYLLANIKDIVIDADATGTRRVALANSTRTKIEHVKAQEVYASTYNRMLTSFKLVLQYASRVTVVQYLVDLLLSWFNDPMKIFKEYNNVVIMGEPGAGKTVLASALAQLFGTLGIVADVDYRADNTAIVKEHTASNFIGQYVGQTGPKTLSVLNQNIEKVLFIDEAYSLVSDSDSKGESAGYGEEAIAEIVNFLSTNIGKCVLVMAGYEEEMQDLLVSNVGLQRRFPHKIVLGHIDADYAASVLKSLLKTYNPKYNTDQIDAPFKELYTLCQDLYKMPTANDKKLRAKQLARTLFGNGVGSIVNFSAKLQKMIELCNISANQPLPACLIQWTIGLYTTLTATMTIMDPFEEIKRLEEWRKKYPACGDWHDKIQVDVNGNVKPNVNANVRANVLKVSALYQNANAANAGNDAGAGDQAAADEEAPQALLAAHCDQEHGICYTNPDVIKEDVFQDLKREGGPLFITHLIVKQKESGKGPLIPVEKQIQKVAKAVNGAGTSYLKINFSDGTTYNAYKHKYMSWYAPARCIDAMYNEKIAEEKAAAAVQGGKGRTNKATNKSNSKSNSKSNGKNKVRTQKKSGPIV